MQADPSPAPVFDALAAERGNPLGDPGESMPAPSFDLGPDWPPHDYDPPTIEFPTLPAPDSTSALAALDNGFLPTAPPPTEEFPP